MNEKESKNRVVRGICKLADEDDCIVIAHL